MNANHSRDLTAEREAAEAATRAAHRPPTFGPDGRHFSPEYVAYMGGPITAIMERPDADCLTAGDGSCVSPKACMHGPGSS